MYGLSNALGVVTPQSHSFEHNRFNARSPRKLAAAKKPLATVGCAAQVLHDYLFKNPSTKNKNFKCIYIYMYTYVQFKLLTAITGSEKLI